MDVKTYLIFDGNLYKIGKSINPVKRLKQLRTANPNCELVCFGSGIEEKYLHDYYFKDRIKGEWFNLTAKKVEDIKKLMTNGKSLGEFNIDENLRICSWKLSSDEKSAIQTGLKQAIIRNKKYTFTFGKYKGVKITNMTSPDEIQYCIWLSGEKKKNAQSKRSLKNDKVYQAVNWWLKEVSKVEKVK